MDKYSFCPERALFHHHWAPRPMMMNTNSIALKGHNYYSYYYINPTNIVHYIPFHSLQETPDIHLESFVRNDALFDYEYIL